MCTRRSRSAEPDAFPRPFIIHFSLQHSAFSIAGSHHRRRHHAASRPRTSSRRAGFRSSCSRSRRVLGGLVRTEHVDGFTVDAGADSMLATKPAAIDFCEELGLGPRLMSKRRRARHSSCAASPALAPLAIGVRYPDHVERAGDLRFAAAERPETAGGHLEPDADCVVFRRHPCRTTRVRKISRSPTSSGNTSVPRRWDSSPSRCLAAFTLAMSSSSRSTRWPRHLRNAFARGQLFTPSSKPTAPGDGMFKALRGGMSELVAAVERRLPDGCIRLKSGVRSVTRTPGAGNAWRVAYEGGGFDASAVILACPTYAAAQAASNRRPGSLRAVCRGSIRVDGQCRAGLATRDVSHTLSRAAGLLWLGAQLAANHGVYLGLIEMAGPRDSREVLLRAFLGGIPDPEAVTLSDAQLLDIAARDVSSVLSTSGAPTTARVYRWNRAGAQHNVGHAERQTQIDARLRRTLGCLSAAAASDRSACRTVSPTAELLPAPVRAEYVGLSIDVSRFTNA